MKKKLIIISTNSIPVYLEKTSDDILAVSLSSINELNKHLINFKTIKDFLDRKEILMFNKNFEKDFRKWVSDCDYLLEKQNSEKSCLPNAFWLMHRMLNYLFIIKLSKKIKEKYDVFDFITHNKPSQSISINDGISNLSFSTNENSLEGFINTLYMTLNSKFLHIIKKDNLSHKFIYLYAKSILSRSFDIAKRRLSGKLLDFIFFFKSKKSRIGVLQKGYDVDFIINKYKDNDYIFFKDLIIKEIFHAKKEDSKLQIKVKKVSENFFLKWFSNIGFQLLDCYSTQITFLSIISKEITKFSKINLEKYKVNSLLCSIGIQDQVEYIFARECLKSSVTIHSFKHAGIESLFLDRSLLDPYLEKNIYPKRVQYVYSNLEKEFFKDKIEISTFVSGRLNLPKIKKNTYPKKRILYSMGPENFTSFKEMDRMLFDVERFNLIKEILSACSFYNQSLDIKMHPKGKITQFETLESMKKQFSDKKIRIILEGTIERILYDYDLVIIDILNTRVFTSLLYLNIPIVIYIPIDIKLNNLNMLDLKKIAYIIREPSHIFDIIEKYNDSSFFLKNRESFNKKFLSYPQKNDLLKKIIENIN